MLLSTQIAAQIPYLRRYARALTGSQASGDAYVMTLLEAIVEDPEILPRGLEGRVALYKIFSNLWSSVVPKNGPHAEDANFNQHDFAHFTLVAQLSPLSRQVVLLLYIEGFTKQEVSVILNVQAAQLDALLEEACQEFAENVSTDVLIVEDEVVISTELSLIVRDLGHSVIGVARTMEEAAAAAGERKPGLILADIKLADGSSGLDAANAIIKDGLPPVIFITAYPERFLSGVKPEPAFLIPKPYKIETVATTINQALFLARKKPDVVRTLH
jgi:CheY-like chemotaxis protein